MSDVKRTTASVDLSSLPFAVGDEVVAFSLGRGVHGRVSALHASGMVLETVDAKTSTPRTWIPWALLAQVEFDLPKSS